MNKSILNTSVQEFINNNLNSNITDLLLKGLPFNSIDSKLIIEQIESKNKCQLKLPTWYNTKQIYYPNKINIEQTSSELAAAYKSNLISGNSIIDITGGFGVDSYYFSKQFKEVFHCEIDENLSKIVEYNTAQLNIDSIHCIAGDGIIFLEKSNKRFDWIFADPSRRNDSKGKVFYLKDCIPNIPLHLETIFSHTNNILIKTSPLLDITIGLNELKFVKEIHIVAIDNEVKELLWILNKEFNSPIEIKTINIKKNQNEYFNFYLENEAISDVNYTEPQNYLYEPNSAILKSGAFKSVSKNYNISKLHQHSHLYTSEQLFDFPGRVFKINKVMPYNKQLLKKELLYKANITIRNFPETVQQLRKKLKIAEGGMDYLFFTTNCNNSKIVVFCSKIN